MAVKYFDKEKNEWVIFPGTIGTPGKDAYQTAVDNGYSGSKEDYNDSLVSIPNVVKAVESADSTPTKDSTNLITSGAVYNAVENIDIPSLDEYAKKTDIPSVPSKVSAFENDANYATTSDVDSAKGYADSLASNYDAAGAAADVKSWVENQNYLTQHQDISSLATKSELSVVENKIPSLDSYYTKDQVDDKIADAGSVDLTNYYTKEEANNEFITDGELNEAMTSIKDGVKFSKASAAGAPGYWDESVAENSVTLSGYSELNSFGMIVTDINTNLTFIGNHAILSNVDNLEPSGNYKVYCIIYANGMHYINVAYYK